MTKAAIQLMHDLLAKSAEAGETEFDPFELLNTPEPLLNELERNGYIARSKTIRRKIVLTDLALHGETELQTTSASETQHKRRKPHRTHSSQKDNNLGKKTLHWNIAGVIVTAIAGIVVPLVVWWLSHIWP